MNRGLTGLKRHEGDDRITELMTEFYFLGELTLVHTKVLGVLTTLKYGSESSKNIFFCGFVRNRSHSRNDCIHCNHINILTSCTVVFSICSES